MTRLSAFGLAVSLWFFVAPARADEPRAIILRAIKAAGGDAELARNVSTSAKFTLKGTDVGPFQAVGEVQFAAIDGMRLEVTLNLGTETERAVIAFDGKKGWAKVRGGIEAMPESEVTTARAIIRLMSPTLLPHLLADMNVTLTALPAGVVDGRPTHGVKATFGDKAEIRLQFDQETGFLVSKSTKFPEGPGEELEILLSAYSDAGTAEDERVLKEAGLERNGPALVAFLRKQAPDPKKVARAAASVRALGDEQFEVREQAAADLVALGNVAVPHLERAQKHPDAEVARQAKQCLEVITKRNDGRVLFAAIRQAVLAQPEGATDALLKMLPGANEATSREARAALAALAGADGTPSPVLVKAFQGPDPAMRDAAAAVLGKDGGAYLKQPGRRLFIRGLKQPGKIKLLMGGKPIADMEITGIQYFNEMDAKLYARP